MMLAATQALLVSALLAVAADPPPTFEQLRAAVDKAPKDVSTFIQRRAGCNHFLGEEPYNRERAADINRALRKGRCDRIPRDERALRSKYRKQPATLKLIDQTADIAGWPND